MAKWNIVESGIKHHKPNQPIKPNLHQVLLIRPVSNCHSFKNQVSSHFYYKICDNFSRKDMDVHLHERTVWRYQRGNQNLYIAEGQTTQWPIEKVQKDKQRSTKHTHKTKDRVTRIPLKTVGELRCSERVSSSCSTKNYPILYIETKLL
jgi:hypothetical protein